MGSGKDTAGLELARQGFLRIAFGDGVKEEVACALHGELSYDDAPLDLRVAMAVLKLQHRFLGEVDPFAKPTGKLMRWVLQHWGTEYRRAQRNSYWVDKWAAKVRATARKNGKDVDIYVPDVRFRNEVAAIKLRAGEVWRINPRPGTVIICGHVIGRVGPRSIQTVHSGPRQRRHDRRSSGEGALDHLP